MSLIFPIPWDSWYIPPTMAGAAAVMVFSCLLEKRNFSQKLFLSITSYLLIWISNGISLLPWEGMWRLWNAVANRPDMATEGGARILSALYVIINLCNLLFIALCMLLMIKILHHVYPEKHRQLEKNELLLLLSPYITIIAGYLLIRFIMQVYENDTRQYLWDHYDFFYWLMTVFQVLSFLTILAVITLYQKIRKGKDEELERAILSEQIQELKGHVDEVEALYRDIRGMRHDLNGHIQVLQYMYREERYTEANAYLADLKKDLDSIEGEIRTGNPVTDIILRQSMKKAEAAGVSLEHRYAFPTHSTISAYDISIILNNTLSNAIEAAAKSRDKKVSITSRMKNELYFIEVNNTFDGELRWDPETGLPESTKTGSHGFGLPNVKKTAEKYFGGVSIRQEKNQVRLVVILVVPASDTTIPASRY